MKEPKHTIGDLYQMQSLPLKAKIIMTQQRIRGWYDHFDGDVYVSFSGGKDSTVLVDIITKMGYMDIPLVFVDTGLEYPEIREFVKGYGDRVTWLRPKMTFKQVIEKYGYPFISKEVSFALDGAKRFLENKEKYKDCKPLAVQRPDDEYKPYALLRLEGQIGKANKEKGYSQFNCQRWRFMLDAPFHFGSKCCDQMKKKPFKEYEKMTGYKPITAQMACESRLRLKNWLLHGCNAFEAANAISNPMSFWTEQDVLLYIKENHLPICSVYGEIVEELEGTENVEGQMTMSDISGWEDMGSFDADRPTLKTTGCDRTGCMFCGFGCHMEKGEGRFERMKHTHPKQYEWIMKPWKDGGLGYKEVIDWINEHGDMNIKY